MKGMDVIPFKVRTVVGEDTLLHCLTCSLTVMQFIDACVFNILFNKLTQQKFSSYSISCIRSICQAGLRSRTHWLEMKLRLVIRVTRMNLIFEYQNVVTAFGELYSETIHNYGKCLSCIDMRSSFKFKSL